MSDDEQAFLNTILAHPDADLPRLVYADWLEEIGQAERAEFIRLQCEYPTSPTPREMDLWGQGSGVWDWNHQEYDGNMAVITRPYWHDGVVAAHGAVQVVIRRGFPAEVRAPLAWLRGGECDECIDDAGPGRTYQRAPGGVLCTGRVCPCKGTGRTPGHLRELVRRWPVTRVVVTDREPERHPNDDRQGIWWGPPYVAPHGPPERSIIYDQVLFDAISAKSFGHPAVAVFLTIEAAVAALSDALLAEAKS